MKTAAQRVVAGESLSAVLRGSAARGGKLKELSVTNNMIVGFIAGAICAVSTHPIWTVNTRAMTSARDGGDKSGFWGSLLDIYQREGLAGLYRGLGPALILVINPTIQYMVYSKCREYYLAAKKPSSAARGAAATANSVEVFVLGAIAKVAATLVTYPYILVKSVMQAGQRGRATEQREPLSQRQSFRALCRARVRGLHKGCAADPAVGADGVVSVLVPGQAAWYTLAGQALRR